MKSNQTHATKSQEFVTIPQDDYPGIALWLKSVSCNYKVLRELLQAKEKNNQPLALGAETKAFEYILSGTHEDLHKVFLQLSGSNDHRHREIGYRLLTCESHSEYVLRYFHDTPVSIDEDDCVKCSVLFRELCETLSSCILDFEQISAAARAVNSSASVLNHENRSSLVEQVRTAINDIDALYRHFYHQDGECEALTNPKGFVSELKRIVDAVWGMGDMTPEGDLEKDLNLAHDLLFYVLKVFRSDMMIESPDTVPLSLSVDNAAGILRGVLHQLVEQIETGGGNAETPIH